MGDGTTEILARIDEALTKTGQSDRQVSKAATGNEWTLKNLRKGSKPGLDIIAKLAPALGTTPEYLAFGVRGGRAAPAAGRGVPIIGQVAAGLWLSVDTEVDAPLFDDRQVPADPNYPVEWQFACEVRGTSINKVAPDGAIIGCIDVRKGRIRTRDGDLVVVEQRREGGHEIMRTAKRLRKTGEGFELHPDSTDPKWRTPIVIRPGQEDESLTIEIIGLVTSTVTLLDKRDRSRDDLSQ